MQSVQLLNDGQMSEWEFTSSYNDGKMRVNDGEMLVNDGKMSVLYDHILISPSLTSI